MQRVAFTLKVKTSALDEYRQLHNPIWPELASELRSVGISNFSLWLQPDGTEFGYLECKSWDEACQYLARSQVNARWQELMQNYLETPLDEAAGAQPIQLIEQIFQLEETP